MLLITRYEKLESIQYNAWLALTGAIRGSLKEKIYQDLGFESLRVRRWYRKLCLFYKVLNNELPQYLFNLIPVRPTLYPTRNALNIPLLNTNHNFFKDSLFPSTIIEWNKLYPGLRKAESLSLLRLISLSSYGHLLTLSTIVIILKDLNLLLYLDLV